ncbi:ABC transporter ATP-binding protein [Falsiroseomonas selenitidurans]|uniref:ABC transporter ATP-binding protein n=1 Tax=Falsiroseomonas selenitidurans TaxID=2716335 RepID=A0ABX1E139_9PROT|nr:ABC transporter ATP-binding protein [Falsiroseomonas selenitidurans]NKC30821.1 ABC transporter ATP-binding protein [Falsiroseomonas selenitidurans]
MPEMLFEVRDLVTRFRTEAGEIHPSRHVSFHLAEGEVLGLVGESGSGKSVTARASVRLQQPEGATIGGALLFRGQDLRKLDAAALRALRARQIAMVVQDPAAALNPVMTIGRQLTRIHRLHGGTEAAAREAALGLLRRMRIAEPEARMAAYPHQLSGGMRQRVLIALALICRPALLIADEPTTALDVTVEAEILALLDELRRELGMAMLMISHNLSVIGRICDRVAVMYAGRIMEEGPTAALLAAPAHPYTRALLASVPRGSKADGPLPAIPGEPPDLARLPAGCPFQSRCPGAAPDCTQDQPLRPIAPGRRAACWRAAA